METKILQVYFGNDALPYKDKGRSVHYPNVGSVFVGENNVTHIRFFVDRIGSTSNVTWIANVKKPNGALSYRILSEKGTAENEHYVELAISDLYSELKGAVVISLQGYSGNLNVEEDDGEYIIHGTPDILTTGVIQVLVNYAPIFLPNKTTLTESAEQQILTLLSQAMLKGEGIYVIANRSGGASTYVEGSVVFSKSDKALYQVIDGEFVFIDYDIGAIKINGVTLSNILSNLREDLEDVGDTLADHIEDTNNPHEVTKEQVGLGNVDNTSDLNKPISSATQSALNEKANDEDVLHIAGNETKNGSLGVKNELGVYDNTYSFKLKITNGVLQVIKDNVVLFEYGDGVLVSHNSIEPNSNSLLDLGSALKHFSAIFTDYINGIAVNNIATKSYTYSKGEVDSALAGKQDTLTFDNVPTSGSTNPVTSAGIKLYVDQNITSLFHYKGSVDTFAELPVNPNVGDVWDVQEKHEGHPAGTNWVWSGSKWDALGGTIDLTDYYNKSQVDYLVAQRVSKTTTVSGHQLDSNITTDQLIQDFNDYGAFDNYYTQQQIANILANYYTKAQTYSKQEVNDLIGGEKIIIECEEDSSVIPGHAVPSLTAEQLQSAYNGLVAGKSVYLKTDTETFVVRQAYNGTSYATIVVDYYDFATLTYQLINNDVSCSAEWDTYEYVA